MVFSLTYLLNILLLSVGLLASALAYSQEQPAPEQKNQAQQELTEAAQATEQAAETNTAPTQPPPKQPVANKKAKAIMPAPVEHWHFEDVKYYEKSKFIKTLLAGDQDFLTIRQEELTGNPKGIAIIIPDWQQHTASPKAVNQLRKHLPLDGWHVVAILPPKKPDDFGQNTGTKAEIDLANKLALDTYKAELTLRAKVLLDEAQNFPGVIMVIAEGINAALLPELFNQKKLAKPGAFVSLSSYLPALGYEEPTSLELARTTFPVLDLYLDKDNIWVQHSAPHRKQAAIKQIKQSFRQIELYSQNINYPDPELSKQIISWMASLGW
jgi:hypothetical protein